MFYNIIIKGWELPIRACSQSFILNVSERNREMRGDTLSFMILLKTVPLSSPLPSCYLMHGLFSACTETSQGRPRNMIQIAISCLASPQTPHLPFNLEPSFQSPIRLIYLPSSDWGWWIGWEGGGRRGDFSQLLCIPIGTQHLTDWAELPRKSLTQMV